MSNEKMIQEYEKMMKGVAYPHTSSDGMFEKFTIFNDSKYETHTYCSIANINS